MAAPRPVDLIPILQNRMDRMDALRQRVCVWCGNEVIENDLSDEDAREYRISALCVACFDNATKDCEE